VIFGLRNLIKMKYCRIQITGSVQGVGFRYFTRLKAVELGLLGSIENQTDGSVVIFVLGDEELVDHFIDWSHYGSPASKVEEVIVKELDIAESMEYKEFSILR